MIVTLGISAETKRKIARDSKLAGQFKAALAASLLTAVTVGAGEISRLLGLGELGIKAETQHPASGLAGSVDGWMTDRNAPTGAIGVPANSPAAKYAGILQRGGTIRPRNAKALAIPVSDEAKRYSSPRDMDGLDLIPRKGKPSLLVRKLAARGRRRANWTIHWVLVKSVRIEPRRWLTRGAATAKGEIADALTDRMREYVRKW